MIKSCMFRHYRGVAFSRTATRPTAAAFATHGNLHKDAKEDSNNLDTQHAEHVHQVYKRFILSAGIVLAHHNTGVSDAMPRSV